MRYRVTSGFVSLHDGRRLEYRSIGPAGGLLVLYMHGAIGAPQCADEGLELLVDELQICYVMVSRPGFGGSDPAPGRTLCGFARDAGTLASRLGHSRFAVIGVSAGGPYALACAHELPQRVVAAAVVGCFAPGADLAAGLPRPARLALGCVRARPRACTRAGDALLRAARRHPRAVQAIVRSRAAPGAERLAVERALAAIGGGVGAIVEDHLVWSREWGFRPADVGILVQLWHGLQDELVPVDQALHLAAELPRVRPALHPDEGHFFYRRRLPEILGDLVAAADRETGARASAPTAGSGRPRAR